MGEPELVFLKLGGSLITDKGTARALRPGVLARLAGEIAAARANTPSARLLIGHGSGSFGHVAAKKYGTRLGVHTPLDWLGFADVWREANLLNRFVMDALLEAGLPAVALPASAGLVARDGLVSAWNLEPFQRALAAGLVPVVFGDVTFDQERGGTIFSTENLFDHMARQLHPGRLLLAGIEGGVYADFPACKQLITRITPENFDRVAPVLGGSAGMDVTGGMFSKVSEMLDLVSAEPQLEVLIFSGLLPGLLQRVLLGETVGTTICSELPIH